MNINLKLVLPLINDEGVKQKIRVDSNLLLQPLYATEEDIVPSFSELINETNLPLLRKILFNASLTVFRRTKVLGKLSLSDSEIFMIRRDYTICLATYQYSVQLSTNSSNGKNNIQSKTLGDFSVTLSSRNTLKDALSPIIDASKACITEMETSIDELEQTMILPRAFIKGSKNPNNLQANDRLWWLKEYGGYRHSYATDKVYFMGQFYKTVVDSSKLKYNPISYYNNGTQLGVWYDTRHIPRP